MTHENFISLVRKQEMVCSEQINDLKEMVEIYPYFVAPRIFLTKAYKDSNDLRFTPFLNETSVYCANRHWFYNYIYPEKVIAEQVKYERINKNSGNYFDMIYAIEAEGGDTRLSLKNLAEKLKEAREFVVNHPSDKVAAVEKVKKNEIAKDYFDMPNKPLKREISEVYAKKMISERKYTDAIEILRELNLNNPKKSVYFADQIRFLEKVISNQSKN
jgi:hypothetical protein